MWLDLINQTNAIEHIYGLEKPSLDAFYVKSVNFDFLTNSLKLSGDLGSYPQEPPLKWRRNKFNTVHIELELWNISKFSFSGYDRFLESKSSLAVDVLFEGNDEGVSCKIHELGFSCNAELLDVMKISAYQA